jgi:hypothetical protein
LLCCGRYYLDATNFGNLQDLQEEDFEQQLAGNQDKCYLDHVNPICFLPLVTHLHALIGLHIPCIPIVLGLWLVDLLSPTVFSRHTSLPSYMILSLTCVFVRVFGPPSLVM